MSLLGVDVGGTFTDAVLAVDGRLVTAKAPTTPEDQSEGVLAAVRAALEKAGVGAGDVESFAHGTTVATNALLEGRGARTALVTTAGFEDLVELGRQARADLYRLCVAHPAPLVPPELRIGVAERMSPDGPLVGLTEEEVRRVVDRVRSFEVEAVAVCLLHSYRHPEHEAALGRALEELGVHVSLSHAVVGTFREYERAATTEVDAALSPLLGAYLRRLVDRSEEAGLPAPDVMQSNGGLASAEEAASHAATTVLSGPAGGAAGAAWIAGDRDALCFDMGGTSCDVCVIEGGRVRETGGRKVGERPIALPMLDLHTVGAGGGSVAWTDAGGALRVGPRSAGARPGPACYGHGGTEPTVTDANVVLGHIDDVVGISLDVDAAREAVATLGLGVEEGARGVIEVANAEMVRALRVMTVERGVDPREMVLLPFGGAGPLHACAIAEELGMREILVPYASGVLAALGLVVSERRRDTVRSVLTTDLSVASEFTEGDRVVCELRYRGQSFELAVEGTTSLRERFEEAHERAYGYRDSDAEVELVSVRITDVEAAKSTILTRIPERIDDFVGPKVIPLPESTLVVAEGWRGEPEEWAVRLWMP